MLWGTFTARLGLSCSVPNLSSRGECLTKNENSGTQIRFHKRRVGRKCGFSLSIVTSKFRADRCKKCTRLFKTAFTLEKSTRKGGRESWPLGSPSGYALVFGWRNLIKVSRIVARNSNFWAAHETVTLRFDYFSIVFIGLFCYMFKKRGYFLLVRAWTTATTKTITATYTFDIQIHTLKDIAWVSGFSGEKGSKKRKKTKEASILTLCGIWLSRASP